MMRLDFCMKKQSEKARPLFLLACFWLIIFVTFDSASAKVFTMPDSPPADSQESRRSVVKVGFENTDLPDNKAMGMIGTTYLIELGKGFYAGPAVYGAVTGRQGGFFTIGGELAWHYPLFSNLELQMGVYAGGGGGGAATTASGKSLWGGGLMLRPHADLLWDFGMLKAGITASHVNFPEDGEVSSSQIGFMIAVDNDFSYYTPDHVGKRAAVRGRQGFGGDRMIATLGSYFPEKVKGVSPESHMGYVGARFERFIAPWLYAGAEGAGAFSGDADGYAEFLGTLGIEQLLWNERFTIGSRLALGMGGGGGVPVGGGFLAKLGAYAAYNISRNAFFALEGGYAMAPDGDFKAPYCSANLAFNLDRPFDTAPEGTVEGYEFSFGSLHYFDAVTKNGEKREMDLIAIKVSRYLNDYFYLTGQGHSAYNGDSGAYSAGLVGLGFKSPKVADRLYAGAEMLFGAAGGGSLDTEGGMVAQPMAFLGMNLTKSLAVRLGAGQIVSVKGDLNSTVLDFALSFEYGANSR